MDRDVTIRFYEIRATEGAGILLEDVIREINDLDKLARERVVSNDITLRLEFLEERGGVLFGDLTRVQTENLPGHVTDEENDPLPVDRIGHPAAFCYDPVSGCLALQFDVKIGVGRVCGYFSQFADGENYGYVPFLRPDALENFEEETPKSFTVKVARRQNFQNADVPLSDFEEKIDAMGALFDAPSVEVTVSCRIEDGGLDKATVLDNLRHILGRRAEIGGINKVAGATIESDEAYNFIKFLLKEHDTLELPANDPVDGRQMRLRFVRRVYARHRDYLRAAAGVA